VCRGSGIVDRDLTPEVVTRWAAAFGTWVREAGRPSVIVGRDSRKSGPRFTAAVIAGLGGAGCRVIDVGLAPTPTIQLAVLHHGAGGGIAITASHNPIEWNALKFIGPDGIFLDGANSARVLDLAAREGRGTGEGGRVEKDPGAIERHLAGVLALPIVRVERIRARKFTVALDAVRGAGGPIMGTLLERLGCSVTGINLETDGDFPRAPEPVPEHLGDLGALVRRSGADLGIAVDPDVDRLAIVDEGGTPIGEDYTLGFAVRAVLGKGDGGRGKGATVVCNLSTSLVVDDAAREYGADVVRTPVGEAHVARKMEELGAPIAYLALAEGTPVYAADGAEVGSVVHVLADEGADVFDGLIIRTGVGPGGHHFVDAPQVAELHEHGVVLTVDARAAETLPEPSVNPAAVAVNPADADESELAAKLRRAWDYLSGRY